MCVVFVFMVLSSCASDPPESDFDEAWWLEQVKAADITKVYAPHIDEKGVYFNPWMPRSEQPRQEVPPDAEGQDAPRRRRGGWFFGNKTPVDPFPEENYTWVENDYAYLKDADFDSISFAGHASTFIKMNGETVITDPLFSDRALILSKKIKIKFDYSQVPQRPVVIISHNHYDHLDKESIKALVKKDAVFLAPMGMKRYFTGLKAKEVYELDWWESVTVGSLTYTFLPSQHWSYRLGYKNSATLWGSWLIEGEKTVYFSGDSGYFRGYEEFGNKYEIDYAIIGTGAYEPRSFMHYNHMSPLEAVMAADDLKAKLMIPMHFGVISLSDEPLIYPLYVLDEYIKANPEYADRIKLLRVGEYLRME
jgi:L-ascorbate metabolism protein UlaG (beta-lactamase superfamily)